VASWEANLILIWLFLILLTGFGVEGLRMAATRDPWAVWSPLGRIAADISTGMVAVETLPLIHRLMWWGHLVLAMGFIAWAPYTKMIHVLTAPFNIYTANPAPGGANLKTIDFDGAETLGVKALSDFTWKDLADLDACTECGRCSQICPAATVGKTLSPRDIILALRARLHAQDNNPPESTDEPDRTDNKLIDTASAVSAAAVWECTTCGACLEACPVFIEQFPKIVDLRRYLVMEEADFPENIQEAMLSLENRGHPFRGVQTTRLDWTAGLEVPLLSDKQKTDILLWVGSTGALQERNQKAISALARLLIRAGVDFAILGREEKSTGDLARRVGNEFLFESLARENIEILGTYQFKTIVTPCPHAYNTLKNEYPRLGGSYAVYHHSEYLAQLLKAGNLKCTPTPSTAITYHDPCYLGRHNRVFEPPRDLIRACSGSPPIEMANCRNLSFCCGGGGGMSFLEEPVEQRLNRERARQVLSTGVDTVAVACPTCLSVLEDGVNGLQGERDVRVRDVAELLWEAIQR
jgi:Fe-S oxidoreductase